MASKTKLPVKRLRELEKVVVAFRDKYHIDLEDICQNDDIIINAYKLIADIIKVIGEYHDPDGDH
jgi:hypothetical protein